MNENESKSLGQNPWFQVVVGAFGLVVFIVAVTSGRWSALPFLALLVIVGWVNALRAFRKRT